MERKWRWLPLMILVVLLCGLGKALYLDKQGHSNARVGALIGHQSLPDLAGKLYQIPDDFHHPLAIVHVWASWCHACRFEMKQWLSLQKDLQNLPVHVIGVAYKDNAQAVRLWLQRYGNPYHQVLLDDQGALAMRLGVYGTPETYLLDRSGRILIKQVGALSSAQWHETWLPWIARYQKETLHAH